MTKMFQKDNCDMLCFCSTNEMGLGEGEKQRVTSSDQRTTVKGTKVTDKALKSRGYVQNIRRIPSYEELLAPHVDVNLALGLRCIDDSRWTSNRAYQSTYNVARLTPPRKGTPAAGLPWSRMNVLWHETFPVDRGSAKRADDFLEG